MSNALTTITNDIYGVKANFESVNVDRSINFEREAGFAVQIISGNEYLLGVAMSNRDSVINAVTNIAAIGISLNPAKKQAYLVPRDRKVCLDISYMGLLDLAVASGSIMWGKAELVRESDNFLLDGYDKAPIHKRAPFAKDRGEVIGVYVVAKTHSGDYLTETMTIAEVNDIRNRSSAWKAWVEKKKSCPWVTDPGEMAKKTVIKRAYKTWPKTDRLDTAVHFLNTDGEEGLESLRKEANVCPEDVLSGWCSKAKTAANEEELKKVWRDGLAEIKPTKDMRAYNTFKDTCSARGEALKSPPPDDGKTIDMATGQPADRQPGADDDLNADFQRQMQKEQAQ